MKSLFISLILIIFIAFFVGCEKIMNNLEDIEDTDDIFYTDYTQSWVGTYNGACDYYDAYSGRTYKDKSTVIYVRKYNQNESNSISFSISIGSISGLCDGIIHSHNSIIISKQYGNIRYTCSASKSGDKIVGKFIREKQLTSGGYELEWEATYNVSK